MISPLYEHYIPDFAKPAVTENLVLSACMGWCRQNGLDPIRNNTGAFTKEYRSKKTGAISKHHIRVGKKGSGDILACTKSGRWLEIEAKGSDGKQSPEQVLRQRYIEAMGGIYILARSVDDLEARRGEIL